MNEAFEHIPDPDFFYLQAESAQIRAVVYWLWQREVEHNTQLLTATD